MPTRTRVLDPDLEARLGALDVRYPARARAAAAAELRAALQTGRAALHARMLAKPSAAGTLRGDYAALTDAVLTAAHGFVTKRLHPAANPTAAERLAVVAVGGYGRAEMAPFSDVDVMFLTPTKATAWSEQVVEHLLYLLWDLGLKIGQSFRSTDDVIREAKADLTIRTALLEGRFVCGDRASFDVTSQRFRREVVAGTARPYITDKLAERTLRHQRMGDTRYVVEPNLKEGKGGLRDLHTLFWIGKYVYQVETVGELVAKGLLSAAELNQFRRAENFLWSVRILLHDLTGRAEERLTFDVQRELAALLGYRARAALQPVERFMRHYFLTARQVGDLTGLFLAHLDEQFGRSPWWPALKRRPGRLNGFTLQRGRIGVPSDGFFRADPVRLIELFALADRHDLEIHPLAMRAARRDAPLIDDATRADPRANALFMGVLTSSRNPEAVLRWMNEAGVFGRFVPDFGRVVAQMQYDMYHHYTVDEHTIRAIGLVARIGSGSLVDEHPVATGILKTLVSRRVLHVAVLLHDIAKGRGGDHSVLGAEVAERLCPRLGMDAAETELVAWLVRHHLLMSATAFKRDLSDYKTIIDFAETVASPERLRLLLVLTVVDIRAVGPGVWNDWKGQLLRTLYQSAEELLRLGHKAEGRAVRIAAKQAELARALAWPAAQFAAYAARLPDSYWVAESSDALAANAVTVAGAGDAPLTVRCEPGLRPGTTLVQIYAADHTGLFYRIAGAISLAGANIVDARVHTTRDGMALDNLVVTDPLGRPFAEADQLARLRRMIADALSGQLRLADRLAERPLARPRATVFLVEPRVLIDNAASNRFTVIEVNARDRPALLYALAYALFAGRANVRSAHVATYGERAVDVFYVTDLTGEKITAAPRLRALEHGLLAAAAGIPAQAAAA